MFYFVDVGSGWFRNFTPSGRPNFRVNRQRTTYAAECPEFGGPGLIKKSLLVVDTRSVLEKELTTITTKSEKTRKYGYV